MRALSGVRPGDPATIRTAPASGNAPPFEQVATSVGGFDAVAVGVHQHDLADLPRRLSAILAPVAKAGAEPVRHGVDLQLLHHLCPSDGGAPLFGTERRGCLSGAAPGLPRRARGDPGSTAAPVLRAAFMRSAGIVQTAASRSIVPCRRGPRRSRAVSIRSSKESTALRYTPRAPHLRDRRVGAITLRYAPLDHGTDAPPDAPGGLRLRGPDPQQHGHESVAVKASPGMSASGGAVSGACSSASSARSSSSLSATGVDPWPKPARRGRNGPSGRRGGYWQEGRRRRGARAGVPFYVVTGS